MFTGIVEEVGTVEEVKRGAKSLEISIEGEVIFEDLKIGDSVSTNGVCLTVTSIKDHRFTADIMYETLRRSSLEGLRPGSKVNLERAMAANGRFGGHMVSGHIDGVGTIVEKRPLDIATYYTVQVSQDLTKYMIEKGSIALDGLSLTIVEVGRDQVTVSIIPHTMEATTLGSKRPGDKLNVEVDMVWKYIEKLMTPSHSGITESFLIEHGF